MMFKYHCLRLLVVGVLLFPNLGWSAEPTPVSLPIPTSERIVLTVTGKDGNARGFTLAQIEALGTYRITTKTFWPADDGTYEGIMLADLLKETGLQDLSMLQVTALNGYSVKIPSEDWTRWQVMLATRRDGRPITVRNKGPLRLIFSMALDEKLAERTMGTHWAWMIKTIGPPLK